MSDSTGPGTDCIEYSSFGADIDILAVKGRPARHIQVVDAGAGTKLVAIEVAGGGAATRTLTTFDYWERSLQVTKIKTTTTVAILQITW